MDLVICPPKQPGTGITGLFFFFLAFFVPNWTQLHALKVFLSLIAFLLTHSLPLRTQGGSAALIWIQTSIRQMVCLAYSKLSPNPRKAPIPFKGSFLLFPSLLHTATRKYLYLFKQRCLPQPPHLHQIYLMPKGKKINQQILFP